MFPSISYATVMTCSKGKVITRLYIVVPLPLPYVALGKKAPFSKREYKYALAGIFSYSATRGLTLAVMSCCGYIRIVLFHADFHAS